MCYFAEQEPGLANTLSREKGIPRGELSQKGHGMVPEMAFASERNHLHFKPFAHN